MYLYLIHTHVFRLGTREFYAQMIQGLFGFFSLKKIYEKIFNAKAIY